MKVKIASINIKGDGIDVISIRNKIVKAIEGDADNYNENFETHLKQIRNYQGFVIKEHLDVYRIGE